MTREKNKMTVKDIAISIKHMHSYPDNNNTLLLVFTDSEAKNGFEDTIMQHYNVVAETKINTNE